MYLRKPPAAVVNMATRVMLVVAERKADLMKTISATVCSAAD